MWALVVRAEDQESLRLGLEILGLVFSVCGGLTIRGFEKERPERVAPEAVFILALVTGLVLGSAVLFGFLGVLKYVRGLYLPSPWFLALSTFLTAAAVFGAGPEITCNVIIDSLLIGAVITGVSFAAVNGCLEAVERATVEGVCAWLTLCAGIGLVVRALLWAREEEESGRRRDLEDNENWDKS